MTAEDSPVEEDGGKKGGRDAFEAGGLGADGGGRGEEAEGGAEHLGSVCLGVVRG